MAHDMPASPLKMYLDITKSVMESGPLSLDQIAALLKVDASILKIKVNFLVNEKMIKEKNNNPNVTYAIATKGIRVLKFFRIEPRIKIRS